MRDCGGLRWSAVSASGRQRSRWQAIDERRRSLAARKRHHEGPANSVLYGLLAWYFNQVIPWSEYGTPKPGQDKSDSTSLQLECSARARSGKSIHASRPFREMIARPKISRNEWKTAEL
jgi:hypothetical protein